jgi:hypothetical protein
MKEKGKSRPKVAGSSMSFMNSQEELPTWKLGKICIP